MVWVKSADHVANPAKYFSTSVAGVAELRRLPAAKSSRPSAAVCTIRVAAFTDWPSWIGGGTLYSCGGGAPKISLAPFECRGPTNPAASIGSTNRAGRVSALVRRPETAHDARLH